MDATPGDMAYHFSPGAWSELSTPSSRLCPRETAPPVHTLGDFLAYNFLFLQPWTSGGQGQDPVHLSNGT